MVSQLLASGWLTSWFISILICFRRFYLYVYHLLYCLLLAQTFIVYYWVGSGSKTSTRVAAAYNAQALCSKLQNVPQVVRLLDGDETIEFLFLFKGALRVIVSDDIISDGKLRIRATSSALLRVYGNSDSTLGLKEMEFSSSSLDSRYCHLVFAESRVFIWAGVNVLGVQISATVLLVNQYTGSRTVQTLLEEEETPTFWELLGEREYIPEGYLLDVELVPSNREPALFRVANHADFSLETVRYHIHLSTN